jgi:succinate dehydrogenase / fumarate reductase cytochrome b subunit
MSLTGLGAIGFLVVHLLGNTVIFDGASTFNAYARSLHAIPFLPLMEISLGLLFLAHITLGIVLTLKNAAARPTPYAARTDAGAKSFASTTMIYTGSVILAYMLYHVWTIAVAPGAHTPAFDRVKSALVNPWSAAAYLVGLAALGLHLSHGASSALLTLGLRHPLHDAWVDVFGKVAAVLLSATFASIVGWFLIKGGPAEDTHAGSQQPVPEHRIGTPGGNGQRSGELPDGYGQKPPGGGYEQ